MVIMSSIWTEITSLSTEVSIFVFAIQHEAHTILMTKLMQKKMIVSLSHFFSDWKALRTSEISFSLTKSKMPEIIIMVSDKISWIKMMIL